MKHERDKTVAALNDLIETCKDGQKGYRSAADSAHDPELKQLFSRYSAQRAAFAAELQKEVRRHGGHPEKGGTVLGTLHRGWLNLKSALLGQSDAALIAECASGEDAALKNYEAASHEVLPPDVQQLVARQYKEIKDAHQRVRALKHAAAGK
jgi:uncharacterized protein (TIGR02284 family)